MLFEGGFLRFLKGIFEVGGWSLALKWPIGIS